MIKLKIPGSPLTLNHLVLDYNGTVAVDGELLPGVAEKILEISNHLNIHIVTADTHGTVAQKLSPLPCTLHIIPLDNQDQAKLAYLEELGSNTVAAMGNGRNDCLMLKQAALGIGMLQKEGGNVMALQQADILCTNILDGLDLLLQPRRLIATMRN